MKKLIALLMVLAMVFALVACTAKPADKPADKPAEAGMKVALVTDVGNIDDKSFNQGAWEGVVAFCEAKGMKQGEGYNYYRPSEDSTEARVETIKGAIAGGANAIVCPGYLFEEAIFLVQKDYPDVMFLLLDGEPHSADYATYETAENTHNILYQEEQAGFFAGYAAVKDGYKKLGFLGGMAVPAVVRYGYGFVQGANMAAEEMGIADQVYRQAKLAVPQFNEYYYGYDPYMAYMVASSFGDAGARGVASGASSSGGSSSFGGGGGSFSGGGGGGLR